MASAIGKKEKQSGNSVGVSMSSELLAQEKLSMEGGTGALAEASSYGSSL